MRERSGWKTKAWSLGKFLTESDAILFGISMVTKSLLSILKRADHSEIATKSRAALSAAHSTRQWALPAITPMERQIRRVEDEGGRVVLTLLSDNGNGEGYGTAKAVAQRAAKQRPKEMRLASLSCEAGSKWGLENNNRVPQTHRRRKEVRLSSIPAAQIRSRRHGCPSSKDRKGARRALLVVWKQQADSHAPHAELP